jgi:uncharacterized cupin superfamily protein
MTLIRRRFLRSHMHPGAQEILFVIEGSVTVEIEGQTPTVLKAGQIALMPAEIPHLARNDSGGGARALVTHSRADKDKPFVVVVKGRRRERANALTSAEGLSAAYPATISNARVGWCLLSLCLAVHHRGDHVMRQSVPEEPGERSNV